jgi:FAD/FMN-containing dehydrogenase
MLGRHQFAQRLRRKMRGAVLSNVASRGRSATDASIHQIDPVAVLVPEDSLDLEAALELASEMQVPVLPRGAGSSRCGQTVGEALVIDFSRHFNKVLRLDRVAATVEVEPGVVLDQLNAVLRGHGLWFPVDVSTSAQATLGGMAGNNACGSSSLAYGNMVHHTEGIEIMLADGTVEWFGPFGLWGGKPMRTSRGAALVSRLFEIEHAHHQDIAAHFPRVLRRVGAYNLDVFRPQSVRPYTADGSVNLAHLLVGSEGTLVVFRRLRLRLARLPVHTVLGVVNFASFARAMESTRHLVELKPVAVELVDGNMLDQARRDPAFSRAVDSALANPGGAAHEAILLVEFCGEDSGELLRKLDDLEVCLADLALGGALVRICDASAQKALCDAEAVLRAAGCTVVPQHTLVGTDAPLRCGRTMLARGDVEGARRVLSRTLAVLRSWLDRGAWVVGLEPSCVLTLRDELLVMRLDARGTRQLASRAMLFAEFLERELAQESLALRLAPLPNARALVHGHCHQKAFDAIVPSMALLARIPGLESTLLGSGCCGMAGAFGYHTEHYTLSMAMAEDVLLPAVRRAQAQDLVVAEGTSCRHQIADGTGRKAVHLVSVVARSAGLVPVVAPSLPEAFEQKKEEERKWRWIRSCGARHSNTTNMEDRGRSRWSPPSN